MNISLKLKAHLYMSKDICWVKSILLKKWSFYLKDRVTLIFLFIFHKQNLYLWMPEKLLTECYRLNVTNFTADIASIKGSFVSNPKNIQFLWKQVWWLVYCCHGFQTQHICWQPTTLQEGFVTQWYNVKPDRLEIGCFELKMEKIFPKRSKYL